MATRTGTQSLLVVLAVVFLAVPGWLESPALADDKAAGDSVHKSFLAERFSLDVRALTFGIWQEPSYSTQNEGNDFVCLPRYTGDLHLRPDLALNLDPVTLSAKPRMMFRYSVWGSGATKGDTKTDDDWYVNEWLARWKARENLFLSYGRENLQWGPSYLFSPSNPFFPDNGKRNPYLEVPGEDFGRVVWLPSSAWTVSAIVNTAKGRNEPLGSFPFQKTFAVKVDYTGRESYATAILSHTGGTKTALGLLGGWTVSDALLIYGEGAISEGSKALYPLEDHTSPFGISMAQTRQYASTLEPVFLLGASYTFASQGALTIEYAYYGPGYSRTEAEQYYSLRRKGAQALGFSGPITGLGKMTLGQTAATGLRFLRKNYFMLQYTESNIRNAVDLTCRWTQNLDDGSGQFTSLLSYSLRKHLELFSVATVMAGGKNTEFRSLLDYQLMAGVQYTF